MAVPILENGSSVVDAGFLSSEHPSPPANTKVMNTDADIMGAIDKVIAEFKKLSEKELTDRPATDSKMAAFLHQELKLTLFEASNRQFWHYLTVVRCPEYVSWRFKKGTNPTAKYLFLGPWYRNALGRLWWWAEYSHDPAAGNDKYSRTIRAGQSQEFMRNTIENSFCGNRALVRRLCDAAFPAVGTSMKDEQHREMIKRINAMLVTTALDTLQASEIDVVVKSIVKEMKTSGEPATAQAAPKKRGFLGRLVGRQ